MTNAFPFNIVCLQTYYSFLQLITSTWLFYLKSSVGGTRLFPVFLITLSFSTKNKILKTHFHQDSSVI